MLQQLLLVRELIARHGGPVVAEAFLVLLGQLPRDERAYVSINECLINSLPKANLQASFVHRVVMMQSGCRFGVVYASALEQILPGFAQEMVSNLKSEWEQLHRSPCPSSCEDCDGIGAIQELIYLTDVSSIFVNTEVTLLTPKWANDPLLAAILMISIATAWTVRHSGSRMCGYQNIPAQNIQYLVDISDESTRCLDQTFDSWHMIAHAGAIRRAMAHVTETDGYLIERDELLDYP
jgi:hypothetical protein